ncbi:MAG: VOC family protein [Lachnospiraceae bacterium]|nr:VOC family protein [Lachnospiraceae bacterium]
MIKGLDHIGLCVGSLKKSVEFYCDILGFTLIDHTGFEGSDDAAVVMHLKSLMVDAAIVEKEGCQLELLEFKDKESIRPSDAPMNGIGKHHIAIATDNIEVDIKRLENTGVEFYGKVLIDRITDEGDKWVYFKDPDGNAVELIERTGKINIELNKSI